jgi:hypothetical protein
MRYLPVPQVVSESKDAQEAIRVWALEGKQIVSIDTALWSDPAAWGLMLMDLARHISNSCASGDERTYENALRRVLEGFDAERRNPTDVATPITEN